MRLYNLLKNSLGLTKLELKEYLLNHDVTVNGIHVPSSTILKDSDIILVDGKEIKSNPFIYYLYYKPRGILSTISDKDNSYINQIKVPYKVSPAGRLDKDSLGLMILSNDGQFLNEVTGDKSILEKEYIVKVEYKVTDEFLSLMSKSYTMDDRITTPAIVKKIDDYTISVILYEGIYHQVRRLVKLSKNKVLELKRIRIGNYHLNDMKPNDLIEFKPK